MTTGPNCWQNTRSILRHGPIVAGTGPARAERRASQRTRRDHWADRVMKGIEDTELRHSGAVTQRTPRTPSEFQNKKNVGRRHFSAVDEARRKQ